MKLYRNLLADKLVFVFHKKKVNHDCFTVQKDNQIRMGVLGYLHEAWFALWEYYSN